MSACFYTFALSLKVFLVWQDEPNWAERHQFIQKVKKCTFKGRRSAPVIKKHITSCDFDIPGWIFLHVMSTLSPFISCQLSTVHSTGSVLFKCTSKGQLMVSASVLKHDQYWPRQRASIRNIRENWIQLSLIFIIHTCAFPTVTCRNVQFSTYTGRHPICIYLWDTYVKPSWTVVFVLARCTY